ncbi:hypothetical protein PLICRDRAFT_108798 [Plicaturopsis crispa FD-325 SS-3]|nr:hypothetical protein PLICRDRAFT_108798 [Plicaturopsis crispa FD-325 SS-3]
MQDQLAAAAVLAAEAPAAESSTAAASTAPSAEATAEAKLQSEQDRAERNRRVKAGLNALKDAGCDTTFQFFSDFFTASDQHVSRQSSRLVLDHGVELIELMRKKQPDIVMKWALKVSVEEIAKEGKRLTDAMRPSQQAKLTARLEDWNLETLLAKASAAAPNLCDLLLHLGLDSEHGRKEGNVVLVTLLCMLAQSVNERANEFQEAMGIYFLGCSTPRRQFDVLAHAGLTVSYSKAIDDLKDLSAEGVARMRKMIQERACMIVWDNINIAFKVTEQRHDSKDTFENGTTATLIPLYGVKRGELSLELKEPRTTRKPVFDFKPMDTLPDVKQVVELREAALWHVQRFLLDAYPQLEKAFKKDHGDAPPVIHQIPLHKSEHYPMPAMNIDESSLDGTIEVINTCIVETLKMTDDDMKAHGIMFNGGDLLSLSLTDKAAASRREDTKLLDKLSAYLEGMLGLFHGKLSGTRCTLNEHWGMPNSKYPGSLWSQNALLGRKSISAGWKAKKLPPFRPAHELMVVLSLPAHILDGFRLHCGAATLDEWATKPDLTWKNIVDVSETVMDKVCSASEVEALRDLPEVDRDPQLENTILCNRDMLLLLEFTAAIKRGDVGRVINCISHWMVMFRGTGSMPKYADALFEVINKLKRWEPAVRDAFLNNWLVNLTGKINGFKEIDLLQEHQNFWAKVIYNAKGVNRSWAWLAMVTVVIFTLRDVMRNAQSQFKIPHHGVSHSHPNAKVDIQTLRDWLEQHKLQSYVKNRDGKDEIMRVRDLMVTGAAYASTAKAFKNYRADKRKVVYSRGQPESNTASKVAEDSEDELAEEDDNEEGDAGMEDPAIDEDDLLFDDEEFTAMANEFMDTANEVVGIL